MEKIKLKHWAALLPHNILCQIQTDGKDRDEILKGIEITETGFVLFFGEFEKYPPSEVYPYLNPLDCLTKEIEHNGEKIHPLGKLHYLKIRTPTGRKVKAQYDVITANEYIGTTFKNSYVKGVKINTFNIGNNEYDIMQKLFEWHIDIFGLIDKGLAIKKS